ncbi:MAG: tocopherol cyclase family protein [Halobacteria archaeon]|nr:tocopherol cyclase family protein [Halobacteria archaeon]
MNQNSPRLSLPVERGKPGREVWYSLVTHPEREIAFWYRYTLVSTRAEYQEARIWAALTDGERDRDRSFFVTERVPFDSVDVRSDPFELEFPGGELTSSSAEGSLSFDDNGYNTSVEWDLSYEPDDVTFTPLRSQLLTDIAVAFLGTGRHWSVNQSVFMNGTLEISADSGSETIEFENAPGHQGHTFGTSAPSRWTWLHSNSFEDEDAEDENVVIEALNVEGRASVCFRRGNETYMLNRLHHVLGVGRRSNKTEYNEAGRWKFSSGDRREGVELEVEVEVEVNDPGTWKLARYLTPDGSYRYCAHSSLADVELRYRTPEMDSVRKIETSKARAEWAGENPRVGVEDDYTPNFDM